MPSGTDASLDEQLDSVHGELEDATEKVWQLAKRAGSSGTDIPKPERVQLLTETAERLSLAMKSLREAAMQDDRPPRISGGTTDSEGNPTPG